MKTLLPARTSGIPVLLDEFFKPWNEWFNGDGFSPANGTVPAVNVTETDKSYDVTLAAPGMSKSDFRIDVDNHLLTISSEKEHREEENAKKFTRKEYSYTSFSRSFTIPEEVNSEKIEAEYRDGILHITLPRNATKKEKPGKTIAVK